MTPQRLVVIGSSAGGVESLIELAGALPADFPAPLLVVQHVAAGSLSMLPQILRRAGPLPAAHAQDGEPLVPGHIYIAPPDHHLLVEDGRVAVNRGPKENRFRPSVDALFRSAAYIYGPAVVGVILSGLLDDGTSGLWTVKRRGGTAVVQAPEDALFPEMPRNALDQVDVDHAAPLAQLPALLTRLVRQTPRGEDHMNEEERLRLETEVRVLAGPAVSPEDIMRLGELASIACPDCHGVLVKLREGGDIRYRCHTGHAFSAGALLRGVDQGIEESLWNAVRALEEGTMLLRHLGDHYTEVGELRAAERFLDRAHETEGRARQVRGLLEQSSLNHPVLRGGTPDPQNARLP